MRERERNEGRRFEATRRARVGVIDEKKKGLARQIDNNLLYFSSHTVKRARAYGG